MSVDNSIERYDLVIIGGGIIGTVLLHELTKYELSVALLEKHHDVAEGVTKANSGVLHAGFMVPPGTLKAKLNVRGRPMLVDLARALGVPVNHCGKLVVAKDDSELPYLKRLLDQGAQSGVGGLSLVGADAINRLQPNVRGRYAIRSEHTAVTLPYQIAIACAENAVLNGARVLLNAEVDTIKPVLDGFHIGDSAGRKYHAAVVVNVAGLYADRVMELLTPSPETTYPWRGEYHLLEKGASAIVDMAVYPVPPKNGGGLGVHITPTVNGGVLLGPSADAVSDVEDTDNTSKILEQLKKEVLVLIPELEQFRTIKTYAGVRPKLFGPGSKQTFRDFVIEESEDYPGFVYLLGIESPGVTAAPAIAEYIIDRFVGPKHDLKRRTNWAVRYEGIPRFRWLPLNEKRLLASQFPDYGRVVCHCEQVTAHEIKAAVQNPLGAASVHAIRKRTHATLGRCQSASCLGKIATLILSAGLEPEALSRGTPFAPIIFGSESIPDGSVDQP